MLQGLFLGATAAAQPGPFQAFLLSLIARNGWRKTLPAALAPLISDGPILLIVLLVLTRLPVWVLPLLQIAGGLFLLYLAWGAWHTVRMKPIPANPIAQADKTRVRSSVMKAALMNFLSPSPYIFWATVAGPILVTAWRESPLSGLAFLAGFYAALIGGLMLFIAVFGGLGNIDPRINRGLGLLSVVALLGFGIYQLVVGLNRLGVVQF